MNDAMQRLEEVERKVQQLEDERAIHRTLVRYGFCVDIGDREATADLYTDDCVIETDAGGGTTFEGRSGAAALVDNDVHRSLLPNCAHLMGPLSVEVDGDHAVAIGYAMVVLRRGDAFTIWRQGCGRWELAKRDGSWRIGHRTSIAMGSAAAQDILRGGL